MAAVLAEPEPEPAPQSAGIGAVHGDAASDSLLAVFNEEEVVAAPMIRSPRVG